MEAVRQEATLLREQMQIVKDDIKKVRKRVRATSSQSVTFVLNCH